MRQVFASCCALALALLLLVMPVAAQTVLDMTTDPAALGWTVYDIGSGTATLSGGILTIDTSPPGGATFFGYEAPALDWNAAALTGQYQVEATVRFVAQPATSSAGSGGLHISAADGSRRVFFSVFTDRIELTTSVGSGPFTGTTQYAMDTTNALHTYSIDVNGPLVNVAVDGTPRLSATNAGSTTQNALQFGDLLYANDTISEWDLVTFTSTSVVPNVESSWSAMKSFYR